MSNKSQQYYRRELKAGIPTTIDAGAKFVFLESGVDITIVADSNRAKNRRKGDTITFDVPVKSVSFESDIDQVLEVTLGFGEFDRVVIEDEITVYQGLKGADGEARADTRVKKRFQIQIDQEYSGLDVNQGGATFIADIDQSPCPTPTYGHVYHDGYIYFYRTHDSLVYRQPVTGGWKDAKAITAERDEHDVFLLVVVNGVLYGAGIGGQSTLIKICSIEDGAFGPDSIELPYPVGNIHLIWSDGDDIYFCTSSDSSIEQTEGVYKFTIESGELVKILDKNETPWGCVVIGEFIYFLYRTSGSVEIYQKGNYLKVGEFDIDYGVNDIPDPYKQLIGVEGNFLVFSYGADKIFTSILVQSQDVESVVVGTVLEVGKQRYSGLIREKKSVFDIKSNGLSYSSENGRPVISGALIGYLLGQRYKKVPESYLDHVYGVDIVGGQSLVSGVSSFMSLNRSDNFTYKAGQVVELTIDESLSILEEI